MTWLLIAVFFVGYVFIVLEHKIRLDKAATALMTGVLCWVVYAMQTADKEVVNQQLYEHIADISGILFFLIGAMTIVELIDLYDGFQLIIDKIRTTNKRKLLLIVTILSFLLSSVLDNLTTAIVMTSLVRKILSEKEDRLISIGMIVIASNAGGAWSPIGDVTTTMLWIGNQISPAGIIRSVFIPSLIATLIPLLIMISRLKGEFVPMAKETGNSVRRSDQSVILGSGLVLLLFVPVFKIVTHLPPFMGMMLAVGILWFISERLQRRQSDEGGQSNSIFTALERIDMPSILFFLGILLAVSALQTYGVLALTATYLSHTLHNDTLLISGIGILSAVFDNMPLVAGVQGMFTLDKYPTDHFFWRFLAFCSGTGGSLLIIGSAAGVAAMGIEKITFFWYLRHISLAALLGYLAGALACVLLSGS